MEREDEFHEALIVTIPSLVELLHYRDDRTQALTLSVLEILAKHGELQPFTMWTLLMWM
jgi:hypothetical protein